MTKTINVLPEVKNLIAVASKFSGHQVHIDELLQAAERFIPKYEKGGDDKKVEAIQTTIEKIKQRRSYGQLMQLPMDKDGSHSLMDVYTPIECQEASKHIQLTAENAAVVDEFLQVRSMRDVFEEQEVSMPSRIMMYGPPGTGKTLTAYRVAADLELPLLIVRLDGLISSYMGSTGKNIRKVFEYAIKTPCVLFLDEFDAVAKDRTEKGDVGELTRVVNTLLQCLDMLAHDTVVMAATNLDETLDAAVWRRFDTRMVFDYPDQEGIAAYLEMRGVSTALIPNYCNRIVSLQARGHTCSFADLEQMLIKAKRKAIIRQTTLDEAVFVEAIKEYTNADVNEPIF